MEEQSNNGSASGGGSSSGNGSGSTREREPRESRDRERYHHGGGGGGAAGSNNVLAAAQLLAKPEALTTALTTLASLSSLGSLGGGLLAGLGGSGSGSGHVTGVHRRGGGNYSSGSRSRDDSIVEAVGILSGPNLPLTDDFKKENLISRKKVFFKIKNVKFLRENESRYLSLKSIIP